LTTQTFHVYVGTGLAQHGDIRDTNEVTRVAWFTLEEVAEMLRANAIQDGFSLTALLWFFYRTGGGEAKRD